MSKLEQKSRDPKDLYGRSRYGPGLKSSSSATNKKNAGLSEDQLNEIREAFQLFDPEKSNSIDLRELKAAMRALGVDLTRDEVKVILTQLNKENPSHPSANIRISLDEFISIMSTRLPARDSRAEIDKIFSLFDEDHSGYITFRSLKKVCQELGEGLNDEEIQSMIDEADRDQDGKINADEFYRIMKKRGENPLDDWDSDED